MLSFSLIVATIERTGEVDYLLDSIASQAYPRMECLVIDQNPDNRLVWPITMWSVCMDVRRITCEPGLSRARNVGLQAAAGDIIAFPDDDCWYSPSLLENVSQWFLDHPEFDILTVGAEDFDGSSSGNRWIQERCEITPMNAFRTTFSSTIFVRRTALTGKVRFDESLGVGSGTAFSCGEETDYVLNLLSAGARGFFDRTWHIGHPKRDMLSGHVGGSRASGYGRGMGYVLHKHSQIMLFLFFVLYDFMRSALVAMRGDLRASALCIQHGAGIVSGFRSFEEEASNIHDSNPVAGKRVDA